MKKVFTITIFVLVLGFALFWLYQSVDTVRLIILSAESASKYGREHAMHIALIDSIKQLSLQSFSYILNFVAFITLDVYFFKNKIKKA